MPIPTPTADESENDFIVRAHQAVMEEIADTDARNAAVFRAWRTARGAGDLESKAYSKFAESSFSHARDVPVFAEHEYVDRQGELIKYDLSALREICDQCNHRIADTGDFAALSEGHTPTFAQAQAGAKQPPIVGFSGPFRLGMIGNRNPRWAIFADEHYYRDQVDRVRRMPRRSPEVWLKGRFMDPIAVLGAETPRLDMGMRFARLANGEEVEKYSAAAVSPGASNVFVPGDGESNPPKPKERYAEASGPDTPSNDTPSSEESAMLSPEDVKQIVDAVMQTEPMQWVMQQMQASGGQPAMPGEGAPPAAPPAAPAAPAAPEPAPSAGGPPDEEDKYRRLDEKARYARLEQEKQELEARVTKIENEKRTAERTAKLRELRHTYAFDLDREIQRCSKLGDDQFVEHLETIVENYQRIPVGASLYVPDSIPEMESEKYSRAVSEEAMRITEAERAKGNHGFAYEAALAQAREKIGAAPGGKKTVA